MKFHVRFYEDDESSESPKSFTHYVEVDNYDQSCVNSNDLLNLALSYLDTARTKLPLGGIIFIKPSNDKDPLQNDFDYLDSRSDHWDDFRHRWIYSILLHSIPNFNNRYTLSNIELWNNGEYKETWFWHKNICIDIDTSIYRKDSIYYSKKPTKVHKYHSGHI